MWWFPGWFWLLPTPVFEGMGFNGWLGSSKPVYGMLVVGPEHCNFCEDFMMEPCHKKNINRFVT